MKSLLLALLVCAGLPLFPGGCGPRFKHPGADPQSLSAQTLCFRHAADRTNEAWLAAIERRGLDCEDILEGDPLYEGTRLR